MTQEEKQLLLKDLCARLPYGVKIIDEPAHCSGELFLISTTDMVEYETETDTGVQTIYNIKSYLRPMSSITEEEFKEYHSMLIDVDNSGLMNQGLITKIVDWLDEKMFDHRYLIPMGLALEAPEGMYEIHT